MTSFTQIETQLRIRLPFMKGFKIGKTGQSIKERYEQEYKDSYANIEELGFADNPSVIDGLEEYLIKAFQHLPNCANEQVGGGEMTKSDKYLVYLVYN